MKILGRIIVFALFAFLPLPIIVIALSSITSRGVFTFPPTDLSARWYLEFLTTDNWIKLLLISTVIALVAAAISTFMALLIALVVTRRRFTGARAFETVVLLPLIFPNAALGIAFLGLLGALGIYGTYAGIILAHCILTLPFAYRPIANALAKIDGAAEEAALSLGASPFTVLRTVTLPLIKPGLVTSALFCFTVSFDEATVTVFLISPFATTLPMKVLSHIQESGGPVVAAVSTFLVLITFAIVLILEKTVGLELFVESESGKRRK